MGIDNIEHALLVLVKANGSLVRVDVEVQDTLTLWGQQGSRHGELLMAAVYLQLMVTAHIPAMETEWHGVSLDDLSRRHRSLLLEEPFPEVGLVISIVHIWLCLEIRKFLR